MNMTLDMYKDDTTPINKTITLIKTTNTDAGPCLEVAWPSKSEPDTRHICFYYLNDPTLDFCSCPWDSQYKGMSKALCVHRRMRGMVLYLFRRERLNDADWLSKLCQYRERDILDAEYYINQLLKVQYMVSQEDLLDFNFFDADGNPKDRRCIGAAFKKLAAAGVIEFVCRRAAQYSKRRGGQIIVWRKCNGGK